MKKLIFLLLLATFNAPAAQYSINFCNIWLNTYVYYHPDATALSIKQSELELEMKKLGVYNPQEIEVALDSDDIYSAGENSSKTESDLKYCSEMAEKFIGGKK